MDNDCQSEYSGGAVKPELVYGLPDDITVPGQKVYSRGNTAEAAEAAELLPPACL